MYRNGFYELAYDEIRKVRKKREELERLAYDTYVLAGYE